MSKKNKSVDAAPEVEENEAAVVEAEQEVQAQPEEAAPEAVVEEVSAPEVVVEENSSHNVKIAIKSLPFAPRGRPGMYRAGGAYVVKATEAKELIDAGIASLIEDPCNAEITIPE